MFSYTYLKGGKLDKGVTSQVITRDKEIIKLKVNFSNAQISVKQGLKL